MFSPCALSLRAARLPIYRDPAQIGAQIVAKRAVLQRGPEDYIAQIGVNLILSSQIPGQGYGPQISTYSQAFGDGQSGSIQIPRLTVQSASENLQLSKVKSPRSSVRSARTACIPSSLTSPKLASTATCSSTASAGK